MIITFATYKIFYIHLIPVLLLCPPSNLCFLGVRRRRISWSGPPPPPDQPIKCRPLQNIYSGARNLILFSDAPFFIWFKGIPLNRSKNISEYFFIFFLPYYSKLFDRFKVSFRFRWFRYQLINFEIEYLDFGKLDEIGWRFFLSCHSSLSLSRFTGNARKFGLWLIKRSHVVLPHIPIHIICF